MKQLLKELELEIKIADINRRRGKEGKASESRDAESVKLGRPSKLPLRVDTSMPKAPAKLELKSPIGKSTYKNIRQSAGAP